MNWKCGVEKEGIGFCREYVKTEFSYSDVEKENLCKTCFER